MALAGAAPLAAIGNAVRGALSTHAPAVSATALKRDLAPAKLAEAAARVETKWQPAGTAGKADAAAGKAEADKIALARLKGYTGDACTECGNFTLVRNGTCLKCDTCGNTTGCS
jgi:ribonucleoside-diphosphate reductase alpha chain